MSMNLKIAIAEPSPIVRYGMESLLKHLPGLKVQLIEIALGDALVDSLRMHRPDVLIINPILLGLKSVRHLREEAGCADTRRKMMNRKATSSKRSAPARRRSSFASSRA